MIEINGSKGGGQMLRTALALSAVNQQSFQIENIRGNRSSPGLKNQHLECVRAARRLTDAEVEGAEIGSEKLVFKPQGLENHGFTASIGTAGSITLLFDTVLPITSQFSGSFRMKAKGGTDVKWSPTFEYFRQVKLPLLEKMGVEAESLLEKTGYYPTGGGEAELRTKDHSLEKIDLLERGELQRFEIYSKASSDLGERSVADRQADEAARKLKNSHISVPVEKDVVYEKTDSTGSSLLLKAVYDNSTAGFDSLGEKGKRSEKVAEEAVQEFKSFHSSEAAVDRYMADQLLVFMAIVGGRLRVEEITDHVQTNLEVVELFEINSQVKQEETAVIDLVDR